MSEVQDRIHLATALDHIVVAMGELNKAKEPEIVLALDVIGDRVLAKLDENTKRLLALRDMGHDSPDYARPIVDYNLGEAGE